MIVETHIQLEGEDITLLYYMPAVEEAVRRAKALPVAEAGMNSVTWNIKEIQAVVYGGYYCTCLLDGEAPKIPYRKFGIWVAGRMKTPAGISECVAIVKIFQDSQNTEDIPHSPGYEEPEPMTEDEKKNSSLTGGESKSTASGSVVTMKEPRTGVM